MQYLALIARPPVVSSLQVDRAQRRVSISTCRIQPDGKSISICLLVAQSSLPQHSAEAIIGGSVLPIDFQRLPKRRSRFGEPAQVQAGETEVITRFDRVGILQSMRMCRFRTVFKE